MPDLKLVAAAHQRRTEILKQIGEAISANGYPPSVSEIAATHGTSKQIARRDLDALVADGKIERDPGVARGIRLVGGNLFADWDG